MQQFLIGHLYDHVFDFAVVVMVYFHYFALVFLSAVGVKGCNKRRLADSDFLLHCNRHYTLGCKAAAVDAVNTGYAVLGKVCYLTAGKHALQLSGDLLLRFFDAYDIGAQKFSAFKRYQLFGIRIAYTVTESCRHTVFWAVKGKRANTGRAVSHPYSGEPFVFV